MTELLGRHLDGSVASDWPRDLWICAVRRSDGRRFVFGQDPEESVSLADAVAASACIPGYFTPVTIGGVQFLDGGIHSPTNADLLARSDLDLDLAIVISPMSGGAGAVDGVLRHFARRRLRREVAALRRQGTEVIVFEPGAACSRAMGLNPLATDGIDRVLQAAFFEAGALLSRAGVRRLFPLRNTLR
jgi:NTE family protein